MHGVEVEIGVGWDTNDPAGDCGDRHVDRVEHCGRVEGGLVGDSYPV